MLVSGTYTHGPWTLFKDHWSEPWKARHADTGEVVETGEKHVERAKDTLTMPENQPAAATGAGARYSLMPRRTTANPRGWMI